MAAWPISEGVKLLCPGRKQDLGRVQSHEAAARADNRDHVHFPAEGTMPVDSGGGVLCSAQPQEGQRTSACTFLSACLTLFRVHRPSSSLAEWPTIEFGSCEPTPRRFG
jgi:hypothetical protein